MSALTDPQVSELIERTITDYMDADDLAEWTSEEDNYEGSWDMMRSYVDTCLQALHHHLLDTGLPALTSCWDADCEGRLDGWAMMVSFYTPHESYSLGHWGDDGDLTGDDTAEGIECARAILRNMLGHYVRLLDKGVALGIFEPVPA